MPLDEETVQQLIKQLVDDRNAYLESVNRTQGLLVEAIASAQGIQGGQTSNLTAEAIRRNAGTPSLDVESVLKSMHTGEDDTSTDDNESLFVQEPLQPDSYDEDGLRKHIEEFDWPAPSRKCLDNVLGNRSLLKRKGSVFPESKEEEESDQSNFTHYSIFDVGSDGAPVAVRSAPDAVKISRPLTIFNKLKDTNVDSTKKQAVGKIIIVREPSPILFAALHYTMSKHFDVDELFSFLVDDGPILAHPHDAFAIDRRHRRSFRWTFEYFTIIGDGRTPMTWQRADAEDNKTEPTHIPISRCSSVVALSLEGRPFGKVKNRDRNVKTRFGDVFDPFAPWRVLSIQCYPDWVSTTDDHNSTKHYVNGPEAFLATLKAEYRDARKRLKQVYLAISALVEPPKDFMFHQATRDPMLFEDKDFTYSRRYHWAYHSLGIMNHDITEMVMAYKESFKSNVWDGTNKIVWPGDAAVSSRHSHWRKRLQYLKADFDREVDGLDAIKIMNKELMKEIVGLRDNLFSGTSVLESRKSVDNAVITVQQGQNIKLLTLVTIFFLPLTFVTSVFGMTNMPPNDNFYHFAWSTVCICLPTYVLIGSLNSTKGLEFWTRWTRKIIHAIGKGLANFLNLIHYHPKWARSYFGSLGTDSEKFPLQEATRPLRLRPGELTALEGLAARSTFREDGLAMSRTHTAELDEARMTPPLSPGLRQDSKGGWLEQVESFRPPTRSSIVKFNTKSENVGSRGYKSSNGSVSSPLRTETTNELNALSDTPDLEKGGILEGETEFREDDLPRKKIRMPSFHRTTS